MNRQKPAPPELTTALRGNIVKVPEIIRKEASGITIFGKIIYSILFTTDIAIIKNTNADAIIAVYPFTPHPAITQAIMSSSDVPIFCGVGGGITSGIRSVNVALHAEFQGALGVVLNAPTTLDTIRAVKDAIDVPIILTIVSEYTDVAEKIEAGVDILNISAAANTAEVTREIRKRFPKIPIIATGGPTDETILKTIEAGANAITYTPPTTAELFKDIMEKYRYHEEERKKNN